MEIYRSRAELEAIKFRATLGVGKAAQEQYDVYLSMAFPFMADVEKREAKVVTDMVKGLARIGHIELKRTR